MQLKDLLKVYGFYIEKVKLVRHPRSKKEVKKCLELGFIDEYQSSQDRQVFKDCDYIISFLGGKERSAELYGCYKINGSRKRSKALMPPNYPYPDHFKRGGFYYHLTRTELLGDLEGRLIVDWGKATKAWVQNATNEKEIIAILPKKGIRKVKDFIGYDETILTLGELETIINDPIIYADWHSVLSAINAVYLIVDTKSGKQYVGTSYHSEGLIGRWKCYVETEDGGNQGISEFIIKNEDKNKNFQFSILRVLPKTISANEAISIEALYKKKLQCIKFGLNRN